MKKFLLGTVGLLALGMAAPASAADMAVKAPPPAPLPVIYNWTGFYIGGNGGWGQSNSCLNFVDAFGFDFRDGCASRSGGVVGGQIGYRWQANQWVFGVEAQGDWADLSRSRVACSILRSCSPLAPRPMASASLPARSATPGMQRCST